MHPTSETPWTVTPSRSAAHKLSAHVITRACLPVNGHFDTWRADAPLSGLPSPVPRAGAITLPDSARPPVRRRRALIAAPLRCPYWRLVGEMCTHPESLRTLHQPRNR